MNCLELCLLCLLSLCISETRCRNEDNSSSAKENFVKLTTRQGLIMNQILGMYALSNPSESDCQKDIESYKNGLRAFVPWALKMFDSSSKFQPGLLQGNLMDHGSFTQCLAIREDFKNRRILGKFCFLKIIPGLTILEKILSYRNINGKRFENFRILIEDSNLRWGVCVPDTCSYSDVLSHYNKSIKEITTGLDLTVDLKSSDCTTIEDDPKFGTKEILTILFFGSFIIIALIATLLDVFYVSDKKGRFLDTFSMITNYERIIAKSKPGMLDCMYGMKFLSICYVVVGHRYMMALFFPMDNGLDILDWMMNYTSSLMYGGTVFVDSFFVISGILVGLGFFQYVHKTGSFNIFKFYLYRYMRITLPLTVVVATYANLVQFLGSGPLYRDSYKAVQTSCSDYWWSALLHTQAYVNPHSYCLFQIWHLSCEMPFYFASPLILYPIWKWPIFGLVNYCVIYILSISAAFYVGWTYKFPGSIPITNQILQTEYFQKFYAVPHFRAAPYIIGLGFGYALFNLKGDKVKMSRITLAIGWVIASFFLLSTVVGSSIFISGDYDYNRLVSSTFLSLSRSVWSFGIVWIIWVCVNGYGGIVNAFLTSHLFVVLSRISYGIYITHVGFQYLKSGSRKLPSHFSNFDNMYEAAADVVFVMVISLFFTLIYELPLTRLQSTLFNWRPSVKSATEVSPTEEVKSKI